MAPAPGTEQGRLAVAGLTVRFDGVTAVDRVDVTVPDGEVLAVLGPSGCGKSTLLRAIAGLEEVTAGRVRLGGRELTGLRPDQRGVGLMFQDHALFPHRTVAENVAFGPRMHRLPRTEVAARTTQALALVDLGGYERRAVDELSGGEQQRVALARAVASRPALLLLDEPLGSLDRRLRDRLLDELPRWLHRLGTTVLHVTHDHDEALAVADRVAVMRAGRLERVDTPAELWHDPRTEFVARFLGLEPVLPARVADGTAHTPLGRLPVPGPAGDACLVLLPEALRLLPEAGATRGDEAAVAGRVVARRFAGDHVAVRVAVGEVTVTVPVPSLAVPEPGSDVRLGLDPAGVRRVRPEG